MCFLNSELLSLLPALEDPLSGLTVEELLVHRKKKLQEKKMQIAALASAILSDPENNVSNPGFGYSR